MITFVALELPCVYAPDNTMPARLKSTKVLLCLFRGLMISLFPVAALSLFFYLPVPNHSFKIGYSRSPGFLVSWIRIRLHGPRHRYQYSGKRNTYHD